jgi:hypothetical protein
VVAVTVASFDDRPSRLGGTLTLLLGAFTVAALLSGGPAALVGLVGLLGVTYGLFTGTERALTLGATGLFAGVVTAGAFGAPAEPLVVAAAGTVVTWDVGEQAVSLGQQVGRRAETTSAELVHAAGSVTVATTAVALAYLAFSFLGGSSVLSLVLLLFGAVLIASVLRG